MELVCYLEVNILRDLDVSERWCWGFSLSGILLYVACNLTYPQVSKESVSLAFVGSSTAYHFSKLKALNCFETSGYVKLPATERNIPGDQNASKFTLFVPCNFQHTPHFLSS